MSAHCQTPENVRRVRHRNALIEEIMREAAATGFCDVFLGSLELDDPPRHIIEEFALRAHELETRGRDIEPPLTLLGELKKVCAATGFDLLISTTGWQACVKAPPKDCEKCKGLGRIQRLRGPDITNVADPPLTHMTVILEVCADCQGMGKLAVKRRS